jgi:hypothetical protein
MVREAIQRTRLVWKPSLWGYKLFYERKQWDSDPQWAFDPIERKDHLPELEEYTSHVTHGER